MNKMDNNTYEQEINLKDLMFAVFRKWRIVIIFALIFAVLFAGYKCIRELIHQNDKEYVAELKAKYKTDQEKYNQTKETYERDIKNLNASITNQEEYKKNSVLLKIDPYNEGTASVDIFIKMAEVPENAGIMITSVDFTDSVVKAYASAIQRGEFLKDISTKMGIDLIYLKELVTVTTDYDSNMLNISVTYTDKEGAGKILDVIVDHLNSMSSEIKDNLGQHNLSIMNQEVGVVTDQTLVDYQKKRVEDLVNTNKNLEDTERELKELEDPVKPVALSKISIVKAGVKYGILGCVTGAFLVALLVCGVFIMNGKVNTDHELKNRFGLKFLGGFSYKRKKKALSGVDLLLDRLEGRESVSDTFICDIISANITGLLNKEESVFLTGMVDEDYLAGLAGEIQKRISEIKLGFGSDILHCAESLYKIQQYDTVILVESLKQSKLRNVEKEVELARNMNKRMLGYITIS